MSVVAGGDPAVTQLRRTSIRALSARSPALLEHSGILTTESHPVNDAVPGERDERLGLDS